jgi:S-DNA-T family DNA segregation ATPase FtsK/SpoIIIE
MNDFNSTNNSTFLPRGFREFFRSRFNEAFGLIIIIFTTSIIISIWGFNPNDPIYYFKSSTKGTLNILGNYGSNLSGVLLHLFGVGTAFFCLFGYLWGFKFLRNEQISKKKFRLILLLPSIILLSIFLSLFPLQTIYLPEGTGGVVGHLLNSIIPSLNDGWAFGYLTGGTWPIIVSTLLISVPIYLWSCTASKKEMGSLKTIISPLIYVARSLTRLVLKPVTKKNKVNNLTRKSRRIEPTIASKRKSVNNIRTINIKKPRQRSFNLETSNGYNLPSVELLNPPMEELVGPSDDVLDANSRMLESVLDDFGIKGDIATALTGPVVTRYDLNPSPGTKTSRVVSLADDIARSMSAVSVRVAVVPGQNVIGVELPNSDRETVLLREILESEKWHDTKSSIPVALGKNIAGEPIVRDLSAMPHLLVAGTTGSGKSVAVNGMILSILYKHTPETCRLILVDPKMLELSVYDGIPHLLTPVVTEPSKAVMALKWAVREMEERYKSMSKVGVRNISGYNKRLAQARANGETLFHRVQTGFDPETGKPIYEDQDISLNPLPLIVVVIDEVADLMLVAGKDIEAAVQRLAQMARAAGIHVIMATQRPSVDVITGTIKANFPTRISFQVSSKIDSRTILGEQGGEQLLGKGDMLFMEGGGRITRIHGPFVSDEEVESVVNFLKQQGDPEYDDEVVIERDETSSSTNDYKSNSGDDLYDKAVALVARERKASTSFIQRHLKIGYNRAATIIEKMESEGVVSSSNHVGKREVLIDDHSV